RDFHVTGVQTCALPISFLECDSREFDIARIVFDEQYLVHELSVGRAGFSGGDRSYLDSVRYEPGRMFLSRRRRTLTQIRSRFRRSEESRVGKRSRYWYT